MITQRASALVTELLCQCHESYGINPQSSCHRIPQVLKCHLFTEVDLRYFYCVCFFLLPFPFPFFCFLLARALESGHTPFSGHSGASFSWIFPAKVTKSK